MLDCSSHTPDLEELLFKIYGRSFRVVGVSGVNPSYQRERRVNVFF